MVYALYLNKTVLKNNSGNFRGLLILEDQFYRTSDGPQTHLPVKARNGTARITPEIKRAWMRHQDQ